MAKVDTLALVTFLSSSTNDPSTTDRYYDDAMLELAAENWTCDALAFSITPLQTEVNLGSIVIGPDPVNILALIYDDREIDEIPLRQLEMLDPYWRDSKGMTTSYTEEDVSKKTVALYPTPDRPSTPLGSTFGEPLGGDYATYNAIVFYSQAALDPTQPPSYLELPTALRIMAREFNRESDHPDPALSTLSDQLTMLFKEMLG